MGVSIPFKTLRNELAQTWLNFSLPGKWSSDFINLDCIERWKLICLSLGPAAPSCLYSRRVWPQLFCYFEQVITLKGFDPLLINPWVGFLWFPLTGSNTGSRVVSREATWREAGGRGWSCVNTTFGWICLCDKSTVSQDLSYCMWQPGYQEETVKRVRRKTEESTVPGPGSQYHACVVYWLLKLLHTLQYHINVLIFSKWQKRTKFIMQNFPVYLFSRIINHLCIYAFLSETMLHSILLLKSKKVWAVTEVVNSGACMHFLHTFMTPSKNVTKHCQQSSQYQPPSGGSAHPSSVFMIFTRTEPWKVTAEQFETTCEARRPDLSLFIQNRFTGSLYDQRLGGEKKTKKWLWWRCCVLWKAAMNSLHKPSLEEEDVGCPRDSFYMHQQFSALLMNAHHVSHYQIPVDLLPGN